MTNLVGSMMSATHTPYNTTPKNMTENCYHTLCVIATRCGLCFVLVPHTNAHLKLSTKPAPHTTVSAFLATRLSANTVTMSAQSRFLKDLCIAILQSLKLQSYIFYARQMSEYRHYVYAKKKRCKRWTFIKVHIAQWETTKRILPYEKTVARVLCF